MPNIRPFTTVAIYDPNEINPAKRFKATQFFIIGIRGDIRDVTNKREIKPSEHWRFHEAVSFALYAGRQVCITLANPVTFEETQSVSITLPRHII